MGGVASSVGLVFGRVDVETPPFEVLEKAPEYEVRRFGPRVAAEIVLPKDSSNNVDSDSFRALARYIGVFGTPQNRAAADVAQSDAGDKSEPIAMTAPVVMSDKSEPIAMTAPVVMSDKSEPIAMTAPVVMSDATAAATTTTGSQSMMFLLPSKYKSAAEAPVPLDERIVLRDLPPEVVAVHTFSGSYRMDSARPVGEQLRGWLSRDGLHPAGSMRFQGYNPPFTLPPLRTNEVVFPIDWPPKAKTERN